MKTEAITDVLIGDVLASRVPLGSQVTVKGWVRTRRDSKAGMSFVHVHDGSCFDPLQVVVPQTLANYESDVLKLTAGCSVIVQGELVASEGKGQSVELQASSIEGSLCGLWRGSLPMERTGCGLALAARDAVSPDGSGIRRSADGKAYC